MIKITILKEDSLMRCIVEDNGIGRGQSAINIFDLKDQENKPTGLKVELILPFERLFDANLSTLMYDQSNHYRG